MNFCKTVAAIIAVVIALGIMSSIVFAEGCNRIVDGHICGKPITRVYNGRSVNYTGSHQYGGFLGIGSKTCNYRYYYVYYNYQCPDGHIQSTYTDRYECDHVCGK